MYSHTIGPKYGGLNTTYDKLPYYPISIRQRLQKEEVQPLQRLTKSEAISLCVIRGNQQSTNYSPNNGATYIKSSI